MLKPQGGGKTVQKGSDMKISKRKFQIIKTSDGRYNIALRKSPDHPLDRNGFPDRSAAEKRLNEYIKNVNAAL